jgi:hypothetical protein
LENFGSVSSSGVENGCLDLGGEIGYHLFPSNENLPFVSNNILSKE